MTQPSFDMRVTLLGTGSPIPQIDRFGPATLVEAGGKRLLFDAGRGVVLRLWQLGFQIGSVDTVFLTHFHSDHTVGLPDLWLTGALGGGFGGRITPFHLIGPVGTQRLMAGLEAAYADDLNIRIAEGKANGNIKPVTGFATHVEEYPACGVVYTRDGITVNAFEVDHGPEIKPAVGYRIDYAGRTVVLSGDTRKHPNVIAAARGADLLVHEVASARPGLLQIPIMKLIVNHHTTPAEAGAVFAETRPRLAVFTHLVLLANASIPAPTLDDVVAETRSAYAGPLEVGEDLMSIKIGTDIVVRRHGDTTATRYA